jgi:hypothetical protein
MIIGLVGFIGSGKGTVADILVNDYGFKKESFANPLKDAVSAIFGWDRALLEGDTAESRAFREKVDEFWSSRLGKTVTPRWALQQMGTEAGRNVFGEAVWVTALEKRIQSVDNVVIADVRYPNEIEAITSIGGHVLRVKRGVDPVWYETAFQACTQNKSTLMEHHYPGVHSSEWAWIGYDYSLQQIMNNGTLDDLKSEVKDMLRILNLPATIEYSL